MAIGAAIAGGAAVLSALIGALAGGGGGEQKKPHPGSAMRKPDPIQVPMSQSTPFQPPAPLPVKQGGGRGDILNNLMAKLQGGGL